MSQPEIGGDDELVGPPLPWASTGARRCSMARAGPASHRGGAPASSAVSVAARQGVLDVLHQDVHQDQVALLHGGQAVARGGQHVVAPFVEGTWASPEEADGRDALLSGNIDRSDQVP